jgi:CheY-like chemotaxis protein
VEESWFGFIGCISLYERGFGGTGFGEVPHLPVVPGPVRSIEVMQEKTVILLAEDREDDVLLIRSSLISAGIPYPVHAVKDGEEAIAYLKGEGRYSNRDEYPLPDLLLLDLKMPRIDGFEVLEWIREQPSLRRLRVVVLTSSEQIRDVNRAYELGANSFLVKPVDFKNFLDLGRFITQYWLKIDKAPTTASPPDSAAGSPSRPTLRKPENDQGGVR